MPSKLEAKLFRGDMNAYIEALYKVFRRDFIDNEITYDGKRVDIIHQTYYNDKERTFWHLISEGKEDVNRKPISFRAETLPWAKALIKDNQDCDRIKKWVKYHDKTKRNRHYIWCIEINYIVILEDRGKYYKLITAYPVSENMTPKYMKDYNKHR